MFLIVVMWKDSLFTSFHILFRRFYITILMKKIKDWSQILLVITAIVLLATNVFLIIQNYQLKRAVEQPKLFVTEEGYKFNNLGFKGVDGNEEIINLSDGKQKTLLLIFNTSCQYCEQQYPYWKGLIENLDTTLWRILAVTSEENYDKIKTHLEEHKLQGFKVASISREEMQKSRMLYTPMTLIIGTDGEVKKVWAGLQKNINLDEF